MTALRAILSFLGPIIRDLGPIICNHGPVYAAAAYAFAQSHGWLGQDVGSTIGTAVAAGAVAAHHGGRHIARVRARRKAQAGPGTHISPPVAEAVHGHKARKTPAKHHHGR